MTRPLAPAGHVEGCPTCVHLAGSVRRTDLLAHRGAVKALAQGQATAFDRAMQAHEDAARRLDTHILLDHPQPAPAAPSQAPHGAAAVGGRGAV